MSVKDNDAAVGLNKGKRVGHAFVGRDSQMEFLSARLLSDKDGIEAIAFWGPSGIGKTSLLRAFRDVIRNKWNRGETVYPLAYLDFDDSYQSGNPLEACVELHRQLCPALEWRCMRFELLWACLVRQRGYQVVSRSSRRQDTANESGDLFDLASAWLDAAAHIPFVGAVATTSKLAIKLTGSYLERRHIRALRDWFADTGLLPTEEAGRKAESLQARLFATEPAILERLIAPAFAADLADWARERGSSEQTGRSRLVLILDGYDRLIPHERSSASATFPYQLVVALQDQGVPTLAVIASHNPVRWRLADGAPIKEYQLPGWAETETRHYLSARHVTGDELTERIHLLTRGCPGLMAALLDVSLHESEASLWDRLDEVSEELEGMDPMSPEGCGRFMNWYVDRLERKMAAQHAHLFGFVVSGSALRSFDVDLMRDVVPIPQGTQAALVKLSTYSFLQELTARIPIQGTGQQLPFRDRRFRIHDLVRQAVQLSEIYTAEVADTHRRALAHYDELAREAEAAQRRRISAEVIYHRTCLDADSGLREAEELFRNSIGTHDMTMCDHLVAALKDVPIVEPITHARLLVLDGRRQRARSMYGEAIDCLVQAKSEAQQSDVITRLHIEIIRNLAECYRLHGEAQHAYEEWDELRRVGDQIGDVAIRFLAAEGSLRSHIDHDELDLALRYAVRSDQLLNSLEACGSPLFPELTGDRLRVRRGHLDRQLTRAYRYSGDYRKALHFALRAVQTYQRLDDEYHGAWALVGLGHIHRALGELAAAKECARRAIGVFQPTGEADRHPDPQGISKATQVLLLTMLAEEEPRDPGGAPSPGPSAVSHIPPASSQASLDEFSRLAAQLLAVNNTRVVDPFAPIFANFALGERSRRMGRREEAEDHYEETIKACEKIDGRIEAAYARLGQADLRRCDAAGVRHEEARLCAHMAFLDSKATGYPWVGFYAALEMALLSAPEDVAYWFAQAEQASSRLIYPHKSHWQKELVATVQQALATGNPVLPIAINVP